MDKPGLVKIQFEKLADKVTVLREKKHLSNSQEFRRVFLRSSTSHTDRLIELNFKTILDFIPGEDNFKLTNNGRVMKNQVPCDDQLHRTFQFGMNRQRLDSSHPNPRTSGIQGAISQS